MSRRERAAILLAAALAAGCAAGRPRPGVGDLSFRLAWEGEADLDLYVLSPLGERIDFSRRAAPSGGQLDIDCNVTLPGRAPSPEASGEPAPVKVRCPHPLENVFWPEGAAPPGPYGVQVLLADGEGARTGDHWALEVRFGRQVVRRWDGNVPALATAPFTLNIDYPGPD